MSYAKTSAVLAVVARPRPRPRHRPGGRPGQAEQFTPEFRRSAARTTRSTRRRSRRRTQVKRGQWFEVTVTIGAGGDPPVARRALRPLHRALQGQRRDRARLPAPGVLLSQGGLHHRARRGRHAAGDRRAHAFGGLGELEEDRRHALGARVRNPARVLIADDNPANVRILSMRLAADGYDVVTAARRRGGARGRPRIAARSDPARRHDAEARRHRRSAAG